MHLRLLPMTAMLVGVFAIGQVVSQIPLPAPGFHHLHLNSTDPDAAIAFYVRQFPSTSKTIGAACLRSRRRTMCSSCSTG